MSLCALFVAFLHEVNEEHQIMTFVELSEHDANWVIGTWGCAVIVGGWGVLNTARTMLISLLAPKRAHAIFDKERQDVKDGKRTPGDPINAANWMTKLLIPV